MKQKATPARHDVAIEPNVPARGSESKRPMVDSSKTVCCWLPAAPAASREQPKLLPIWSSRSVRPDLCELILNPRPWPRLSPSHAHDWARGASNPTASIRFRVQLDLTAIGPAGMQALNALPACIPTAVRVELGNKELDSGQEFGWFVVHMPISFIGTIRQCGSLEPTHRFLAKACANG